MDRLPRWTVRNMLSKLFPRAVVPICELHQLEHLLEQTLRVWKQSVETKFASLMHPQKLLSQQLDQEPEKEEDDEDELRKVVELSQEILERKKRQLQEWPDNRQFMKDLSTLRDLKAKAEFNLTEHREWEKVGIRMEQRRLRRLEKESYKSRVHYSRACPVCPNANPSERAVMTKCGHFTCKDCADELADEASGILKCPKCSKETGYVVMVEASAPMEIVTKKRKSVEMMPKNGDLESNLESLQQNSNAKRVKRELHDNNNNDYSTSITIQRRQRIFPVFPVRRPA